MNVYLEKAIVIAGKTTLTLLGTIFFGFTLGASTVFGVYAATGFILHSKKPAVEQQKDDRMTEQETIFAEAYADALKEQQEANTAAAEFADAPVTRYVAMQPSVNR